MFCPNCGKELNVDVELCPECGQRRNDDARNEVNVPREPVPGNKKKRRKGLVWAGVAAGILVLVIAALVILPQFRQDAVGFATPEEAVNASLTATDNYEWLRCRPDFVVRQMAQKNGLSKNASRLRVAQAMDEVNNGTRKIHSVKLMQIASPEDCWIDLEMYDLTEKERASVVEAAQVVVQLSFDDEDGVSNLEVIMQCINLDGKWYVI